MAQKLNLNKYYEETTSSDVAIIM
ncbi:hypothetical protein [Bacteroides sp.]